MLGLKRGTVELVSHQDSWETEAASAVALLQRLFGSAAVDVQHVGSTAVPLIHAKPILDIAVGMRDIRETVSFIPLLGQHGFIYRKEERPDEHLFVAGDFERDTRTHHIHVVPWDGSAWRNYIRFRDLLNADPETAARYDELKAGLAKAYMSDRGAYTAGKAAFIADVLAKE